jgi:hypothetical protein
LNREPAIHRAGRHRREADPGRRRAGRGIKANLLLTLSGLDAVHKDTPAGEFYDLAAGRETIFP